MSRLLTTVLVLSVLFGALFLLRQQPAASGDMPLADWPLGGKSGPITIGAAADTSRDSVRGWRQPAVLIDRFPG